VLSPCNFLQFQAGIRSSTEKAVRVFFDGYPELLDPSAPVYSESIEFLPYDARYEMDFEELNISK
jgi:hypothetical protein